MNLKNQLNTEQLNNVTGGNDISEENETLKEENLNDGKPAITSWTPGYLTKQLDADDLEKVTGGEYDLQTIYCLQSVLDAAYAKFNAWVADNENSTIFEKLAKADEITNEIINSLNADEKEKVEEFKNNLPDVWKDIIKQMAGLYN